MVGNVATVATPVRNDSGVGEGFASPDSETIPAELPGLPADSLPQDAAPVVDPRPTDVASDSREDEPPVTC